MHIGANVSVKSDFDPRRLVLQEEVRTHVSFVAEASDLILNSGGNSGGKPYVCDNGSDVLIQNSKLLYQRIHTGEKFYKHSESFKSFSQNSNLKH